MSDEDEVEEPWMIRACGKYAAHAAHTWTSRFGGACWFCDGEEVLVEL